MNIKKLASSLMMLSLCTVGVGNVSAAAADPAEAGAARLRANIRVDTLRSKNPLDIDGNPILPVHSTEERDRKIVALYEALIDQKIFLLEQVNVIPQGIKGLPKYLNQLFDKGITAERIRAFRDGSLARAAVRRAKNEVDLINHQNATQKIAHVRGGVSASTLCLTQITNLTRTLSRDIVNSRTRDELVNRFAVALAALNFGAINANFDGDTGASATTLTEHRQAVENLWQVVVALARLAGDKIGELQAANDELHVTHDALKQAMRRENGTMLCLHIAYAYYCDNQHSTEESFFDIYERYDPATPENGNKGIRERYEAWLRKVGITEMHKPGTPIGNGDDWDELLRRSDAI